MAVVQVEGNPVKSGYSRTQGFAIVTPLLIIADRTCLSVFGLRTC